MTLRYTGIPCPQYHETEMWLYHYRCFIKLSLWKGNWADPCHICLVILRLFSQQHRVRAQVVQRGAIQQDNYCNNLTYTLWACKWISTIISPLARFFNNCIPIFFFFFWSNNLVKCHAKCKLINKQKLWTLWICIIRLCGVYCGVPYKDQAQISCLGF